MSNLPLPPISTCKVHSFPATTDFPVFLQSTDTDIVHLIKKVQWELTGYGHPSTWDRALQATINMVLCSGYPMALWWGSELHQLYNSVYTPLLDCRHPDAMGKPVADTWLDAWEICEPLAKGVVQNSESVYSQDLPFYLSRSSFIEESWWTFQYSPVFKEDGNVGGILCIANETTQRIITDRRMKTLSELVVSTNRADSVSSGVDSIVRVLSEERHNRDIPFCYLYEVDREHGICRLVGKANENDMQTHLGVMPEVVCLQGAPAVETELGIIRSFAPAEQDMATAAGGSALTLGQNQLLSPLTVLPETKHSSTTSSSSSEADLASSTTTDIPTMLSALFTQILTPPSDFSPSNSLNGVPLNLPIPLPNIIGLPHTLKGFLEFSPNPAAVVLPIHGSSHDSPAVTMIFVAGVNRFHKFDDKFMNFFELLARQLASNLAIADGMEIARRRVNELAELNRAKTTFFANASHELRTPLSLMLGPLSQVLNSAESILSSSDQQLLEMVQRNSKRLMKMVNSLLEFTKIDAGHMRAHFIPTDLPARTREIASVFEPVARQFNLQYVVDCPSWPKRKRLCLGESKRGRTEIGVMEHIARNEEGKVQEWKQHEQEEEGEEEDVYVDVDLWEKVLLNLLSNAFKHCFEGCVTLSLRKIRQDHLAEGGECNMVELSLTDTGIGISADNLPRIFDQFYCVRNGVTRSYEGMGIGLSFVKQIVEMHGGKIFAESELGKGSKFVVRIPVGSGHLPKECLDEIPHMEQETMEQNTQEPMSLQYSVDFPAFQKNSTLFVGEAAEWLVSSPNTTTPRKDSVGSSHVVRRISNAASANSVVSDFQSTRPDTVPSVQDYFSPIAVQQQEKPTVLVVDDNVDMRAYISHILSPHFDVITARDSREAMELALTMCSETIGEVSEGIIETEKKGDEHGEPREHRPRRELSLVLTDIMMPVIDGIELLKKFRSHPSTQNLPIMLLTAKIGDNANVDGLLAGADDYLTKPFSPRELIARVFMHIRLYRMRIAAIQARHQIKLLEAASEAKSKLIALVSHELRTPLQSIIGTIEILQDTELDEEQSDSMYTIRYSSQVLLSIISDILDVAKIEAGNFSFDLNDFNPRTLVQHATDILADKAASKGLELICHVDSNIPDVIHQDAARITQCLCNLIGNAIKFTPQGSVVVRVKQVLMETKHVVENENENTGSRDLEQRTVGLYIEVVDTGIGLSQDSLTKIFEPFRQANSPSTRNHEGVGLGLFISQQLVYKVGGEIGVRSQPNAGSTFWFTWPFLSVDATHSYPSLETIPPVLKYNLRILVVMPNILAGDAAREHLESAGIVKIDVVLNVDAGRGLLETLRAGERRFDAVILDSNLKREECMEFVKWIRNLDESILILLVASRGEHGSSDAGLKAVYQGVSDVIYRPVHRSTLVNKISRRLNADNGFLHRDKSTALTRSTIVSVSSSPAMSISPSMSNLITAVRTSTPPNPKQTLKPVGESAAPSPLSPHRILVAEDNLINQTLLIKQLKKLGYGADPAGNGIEVLNRLEETEKDVTGQGHRKRYSLVLMDVDMPICDGFEATRRIRQSNSDFKDVIIVAITANAMAGDREACLKAGMNDYMHKPIALSQLDQMLHRSLVSISRPSTDLPEQMLSTIS